ncbi:MAG: transglutaminase-like domain-containing protein [Cyclobacteriaceae bacterium]
MDDKELKALVSLLDDPDKEVIAHVEQKIISLGNDIIPYLETEWENNFNPEVQKRIEDLIHALQYEVLKNKLGFWKDNGAEDLLEGVWLLATYQYPDLEYSKIKKELEQIYYEAWLEFKPEVHPFDQIKILNSVIFSKLKFGANTKNFHAPGNSMINVVLESKKGNPISLCVIYLLVAQKLKLPVYGVNLPNLFICTYKSKEVQFYINAFNRGLIFSRADIDNYISHLHIKPLEIFYEPCSNVDIIKRMLRNLVISFEKLGEPHKVDEIKQLLEVVSNGDETLY